MWFLITKQSTYFNQKTPFLAIVCTPPKKYISKHILRDDDMFSQKIKYGIIGIFLIVFWFVLFKDLISESVSTLNPILAYLIYNALLFLGIIFVAQTIENYKTKISIISIIIFLAFDIITAPYFVTQQGTLATDADLWFASSDIFIAVLLEMIGITGKTLYYFTYVLTPIILLILIPIITGNFEQIKKVLRLRH